MHTVKGFGVVSKAEVDVFLELSCFFGDLVDVSSLVSGKPRAKARMVGEGTATEAGKGLCPGRTFLF